MQSKHAASKVKETSTRTKPSAKLKHVQIHVLLPADMVAGLDFIVADAERDPQRWPKPARVDVIRTILGAELVKWQKKRYAFEESQRREQATRLAQEKQLELDTQKKRDRERESNAVLQRELRIGEGKVQEIQAALKVCRKMPNDNPKETLALEIETIAMRAELGTAKAHVKAIKEQIRQAATPS